MQIYPSGKVGGSFCYLESWWCCSPSSWSSWSPRWLLLWWWRLKWFQWWIWFQRFQRFQWLKWLNDPTMTSPPLCWSLKLGRRRSLCGPSFCFSVPPWECCWLFIVFFFVFDVFCCCFPQAFVFFERSTLFCWQCLSHLIFGMVMVNHHSTIVDGDNLWCPFLCKSSKQSTSIMILPTT